MWVDVDMEDSVLHLDAIFEFRGRELSGEHNIYLGHILVELRKVDKGTIAMGKIRILLDF